jgi:hypothetical protein
MAELLRVLALHATLLYVVGGLLEMGLVRESVRSQLGCSIHFGLVGVATLWYLASLNERH